MIRILYEDNHLLVVEKPANMPVMEDSSKDPDVLSVSKQYIKETCHKPGDVYLGLVHRLDRPVGGVMVLARTSKAASRLSDAIRKQAVRKTYLAILDGVPESPEGTLTDYLIKNERMNRVSVTDEAHGKKAMLNYKTLSVIRGRALVQIELLTGRPHQIRVQFASRKLPLVNDQRYHPHPSKGQIALWAYRLSVPHPTTKEQITFTSKPPSGAPWSEFEVIIHGS